MERATGIEPTTSSLGIGGGAGAEVPQERPRYHAGGCRGRDRSVEVSWSGQRGLTPLPRAALHRHKREISEPPDSLGSHLLNSQPDESLASWYQNYLKNRGGVPPVDAERLDWRRFLGSAPDQPFDALRYARWRWFWDFGGGHLTDLYSHYCDVIHWYMGENSPRAVQAMGGRSALPEFECPDTISAAYDYPGGFNVVYNGTLVGSLDGGNILFRGSEGMMKINRDGFAVYREGVVPAEKTHYPEPESAMQSGGDGTFSHVNNFLECVRSRKAPAADVKSAVAAARASHLGNMAYRKGARVDA